ncbi:hypothetical protein [Blastococcus brunescens]|uniref:DUF305 domain-containing protein n=1 Tax=Blastococcus brunescens TaxID=1564165 RepID=A0ABZ1B5N7_9ACTN|nr:hypothetical protein [Blastococcus sp. BMG 8361]WRL65672.1 hypothetical protein U6N30_08875 [Blastococcus sp. BMG 8361]
MAQAHTGDEGRTPAGMAQMHELMEQGNPGTARMHERMEQGNPGMTQIELMHQGTPGHH